MSVSGTASRQRQELPDTVNLTRCPGPVRDESEVEQACEGLIEVASGHAEFQGHRLAPVEGRAGSVGGQGQQDESGDALRPEMSEPLFLQQTGVEPAETAWRTPDQVGVRGHDRLAVHLAAPFLR